jgi:hypothetical protein
MHAVAKMPRKRRDKCGIHHIPRSIASLAELPEVDVVIVLTIQGAKPNN